MSDTVTNRIFDFGTRPVRTCPIHRRRAFNRPSSDRNTGHRRYFFEWRDLRTHSYRTCVNRLYTLKNDHFILLSTP